MLDLFILTLIAMPALYAGRGEAFILILIGWTCGKAITLIFQQNQNENQEEEMPVFARKVKRLNRKD